MIPLKVNYNYFTLYKASSLNLHIWWKRVRFFCLSSVLHIYTTKSRFEVVRYGEKWFHLLLLKRMNENWSLFLIYKSCQRESAIKYYSWFLSRGTKRLIKWIYRERYELLLLKRKQQLNNSLHTIKLKLNVMLGPFQKLNFLWAPNTYFSRWK